MKAFSQSNNGVHVYPSYPLLQYHNYHHWCSCLPPISPATVSQLSSYGVYVSPSYPLRQYHNCSIYFSFCLSATYTSTFYIFFFPKSCSQGAATIFVDHILEINSFGKNSKKKVKPASFQFNKSFKIFR